MTNFTLATRWWHSFGLAPKQVDPPERTLVDWCYFTAHNSNCRKVMCFHKRVSRILSARDGGGGCLPHCMLGYTPWQTRPPGRHPSQVDTPLGSHPQADTLWADTAPHKQQANTFPPSRHPQVDTRPSNTVGYGVNKRAVRILLEYILIISLLC